jgi:AAA family ATP:ADP antiporter
MGEAFQLFLHRAFDIREGEWRRASLMQVNIFLIISTLLIVKPAVNGLFLAKFGVENLPNAFILVAVVAAVVSTVYSRMLLRVSLNRLFTGTLAFSVFSLIFFGLFLRLNFLEGIILYLFYIWVAIFGLLATSQFWVLANMVFNAREAKRLFGFIGAGAIAGGIFGGYLTSLLSSFMSSENLLFICALLLSLCIPITRSIWKEYVEDAQTPFQRKKRIKGFGEHPVNLIRQSRHLSFIAGIVAVSVVVAKLVDYQFSGIASRLIPDADELTAFFGFWFSTFNVLSLLLQLFLTRRVVGTFGVGSSLFFLPVLIFFSAFALLLFPELLMVAVILKMSDGSLKQSINKASMELIILPVPVNLKNQTKTFIDVFVDSLATGVTGIVLIFLVKGLDLSTQVISALTLLLVLVWIYLANQVRKEYLRAFKTRIEAESAGETVPGKKIVSVVTTSVWGGLQKVLETGKPSQILYVLNKIRELQDFRLFDNTRALLQHPSEEVRAAALHNLYFYKERLPIETVEPLTQDPSLEVKVKAFEYLLAYSPENKLTLMESYLGNPDYRVRNAALVSLAIETRSNQEMKDQFQLENRIRSRLEALAGVSEPEELQFRKVNLLKAIGYANIPALHSEINSFFGDEDPKVVEQAIIASGYTLSASFIPQLTGYLTSKTYQQAARTSLLHFGNEIVGVLDNLVDQHALSVEVLRVVPSIVKRVDSQRSVDFLFELLDYGDLTVRQEALRGLNTLRNNFPHLRFDKKHIMRRILDEARLYQDTLSVLYVQLNKSLNNDEHDHKPNSASILDARKSLVELLEKRLDGNLERIFRLLGLKYPSDDIQTIYRGIQSSKPDLRLNSIEFLDNLLEPNLKKVLIPIVETTMLETISQEAIQNLNLKIPDDYSCFGMLLEGKDLRIKYAVLYLIGQLGERKYLPLLAITALDSNEKVRTYSGEVLVKLQATR